MSGNDAFTRKPRLLRITTVPISLKILLKGQLTFFQEQGFEVLAASADGPEVRELTSQGIMHKVVPMTRQITPIRDLVALFSLIRLIRKFKPDIVHTHTPKAGLLGMMAAWICNVPARLHTVAGLPLMESSGVKKRILIFTEKITHACATAVYPNSRGLLAYIIKHIQTKTPVRVIGRGSSNGIDTVHFRRTELLRTKAREIRARYGISDHDVVFSFVGRIVRDKGIGELCAAFKEMLTENNNSVPGIWLLLIGPFEEELDPLRKEDHDFLHNMPRVILAGFQHDVRPWLMASDVFVFPSYREGFPNVVMQASCLEVPCIVSDINGCNELIVDGSSGLIVPARNAGALRQAMKKLAPDSELRSALAAKAREFIVQNYDQQFVWNELLMEYREQLAKDHPRG